jgi:hypothetical protein
MNIGGIAEQTPPKHFECNMTSVVITHNLMRVPHKSPSSIAKARKDNSMLLVLIQVHLLNTRSHGAVSAL